MRVARRDGAYFALGGAGGGAIRDCIGTVRIDSLASGDVAEGAGKGRRVTRGAELCGPIDGDGRTRGYECGCGSG